MTTEQAEIARLRAILRDVAGTAIVMLYDSHKSDTLAEFSLVELNAISAHTEKLRTEKVEAIYRAGFDAAFNP